MQTRKHRLSKENYIGRNIYFITIDTNGDYFKDEEAIYKIRDILNNTAKKYRITNLLTVFMIDHMHLILRGESEDSNLKRCIKTFKSLASIAVKNKNFWHKDFYDHIIRNEKSLSKIIRYTLENPVRKGYVKNYKEWEFSFSEMYKLEEFANIYYDASLDITTL